MINFNAASSAQRTLQQNLRALFVSMERLATGSRINRAADNPAGLIAAESLRAELAALDAETRALERTDAVASVADGGLGAIGGLLSEANALIVANANGAGLSDAERDANQFALDSILSAVDTVASGTSFSGRSLLDGSLTMTAGGETLTLDRVSTSGIGEVEVDGTTYTAADLRSGGSLNIVDGDLESAQLVMQQAIADVSGMRGRIGSFQKNTIDSAINVRRVAIENLSGARSLIVDTDFASEMANLRVSQLAVETSFFAIRQTLEARSSILQLLGR